MIDGFEAYDFAMACGILAALTDRGENPSGFIQEIWSILSIFFTGGYLSYASFAVY